jgi:hypothetical protein
MTDPMLKKTIAEIMSRIGGWKERRGRRICPHNEPHRENVETYEHASMVRGPFLPFSASHTCRMERAAQILQPVVKYMWSSDRR